MTGPAPTGPGDNRPPGHPPTPPPVPGAVASLLFALAMAAALLAGGYFALYIALTRPDPGAGPARDHNSTELPGGAS